MLDDAVAAFLDSVGERAFDESLIAILRAEGFTDIHLVHGQREFGKDIIARKDGEQWCWQSKAGNIGQSDWRSLTGQLDELRLANLGHGSFDTELTRRPILVTTGRLTGNAPDLYRDYNSRAKVKNEPELGLWDRDELTGLLSGNPNAVLRGSVDGQLYAALGAVDSGEATMVSIEVFSRRWTAWEPNRLESLGVIEASLLGELLANANRLDLSAHLALCLVRGSWAAVAGTDSAPPAAEAAGGLFADFATRLWVKCTDSQSDTNWLAREGGASTWVTYHVRCCRIAEIVGLWSLWLSASDAELAHEVARRLSEFVMSEPGCAHPISDQYAVSLIPAVLAVATVDHDAARELVRRAAVWVADAYEKRRLGLASSDADPTEEIEHLLGSPFEWVDRSRRRASLAASVLLDLCALIHEPTLYEDIHNDFCAVELCPCVLRLSSGADQYLRTGHSNSLDPNVDYSEQLVDSDVIAPHHKDQAGIAVCANGHAWDLLACSSALRDRYFFPALRNFARPDPTS